MTDNDYTERIDSVAIESSDRKPKKNVLREDPMRDEVRLKRNSANYNPDAALIQNVLNAFEAFERGRR